MGLLQADSCVDPLLAASAEDTHEGRLGKIIRRQNTDHHHTPGYTTKDDFGDNGDDTIHSPIPSFPQPNDLQANASFPTDGSDPDTVDLVFLDFIGSYVLDALSKAGTHYTESDISYYVPTTFTTNDYLPAYAKMNKKWQKNVPNCPVGQGVGS